MRVVLQFLLLLTCYGSVSGQAAPDTTEIKALLERESASWRSGDEKAHAACWHIQPYSRILVSTADGKCFDVPPALMVQPQPGMMGNGGASVNSNYRFSIHGNAAWVSHDELSTAKDGKRTWSYEIRILEKINGEWKLVGQSVHIYKQE